MPTTLPDPSGDSPVTTFYSLPPELQELTMVCSNSDTLRSLCLASKSVLALARPLLYRCIAFDFSSWSFLSRSRQTMQSISTSGNEESEDKSIEAKQEGFSTRMLRQAALFTTLEDHPDWRLYVKVLIFAIDGTTRIDRPRAARLFASFSNLRRLEIYNLGTTEPDDGTCDFLVATFPPGLLALTLDDADLSLRTICRLLEKVPLLEFLSVMGDSSLDDSSLPRLAGALQLGHLRCLDLCANRQSRSFFTVVSKAAPNLTTLRIDASSFVALDPAHLSSILRLSLLDHVTTTFESTHSYIDPQHFMHQFSSVLSACTSLQSFRLCNYLLRHNLTTSHHLEASRILHRLPPSLGSLTLGGVQFSPSYLLKYLSSPHTALFFLELRRTVVRRDDEDEPVYDTAAEEEVKKICRKRHISLSWIDGPED